MPKASAFQGSKWNDKLGFDKGNKSHLSGVRAKDWKSALPTSGIVFLSLILSVHLCLSSTESYKIIPFFSSNHPHLPSGI